MPEKIGAKWQIFWIKRETDRTPPLVQGFRESERKEKVWDCGGSFTERYERASMLGVLVTRLSDAEVKS